MFEPLSENFEDLLFCSGHSRKTEDGTDVLYSVAALRLAAGGKRERFSSLIQSVPITARDRVRSGVTPKQLAQAPPLAAVRRKLQAFIGSPPFVFLLDERNAANAFQQILAVERTVDLFFAAEFFLPYLESHTPAKLWEFVHEKQRNATAFSALDLAELAEGLLQHICGVELNDRLRPWAPALRWYLMRSRTLFGEALVSVTRSYSRYFGDLFSPCGTEDSDSWEPHLEFSQRNFDADREEPLLQPVSATRMAAYYDGLSRAISGYRLRDEQVRYAENVATALNEGEVLTIEAGTGTGKTQGYLIPLFSFLRENPTLRAVVSTYTKSLQEQIIGNEVIRTVSAFDHFRGMGVTLLKGKSSYVCAEKLDHVFEEDLIGPRLLAWLYALILVFHFRQADLDRVGGRVRVRLGSAGGLFRLLEEVSAKSGCSPRHTKCPAQVVVADALRSRLVVTNHHKLAVLDQDPVLSGRFSLCVIDEANHYEAAARNALGIQIRSTEILAQAGVLADTVPMDPAPMVKSPGMGLAGVASGVRRLKQLCTEVGRLLRSAVPAMRHGELGVFPADRPLVVDEMAERLLGIQRTLADICEPFRQTADVEGPARRVDRRRRRTAAVRSRLMEMADAAGVLADLLFGDDIVRSFRCRKKDWMLDFFPVDVSEAVRERLCERVHAVVFTSATLSRNGDFDCFRESLGLEPESAQDPSKDSSTTYRFVSLPSTAFQKAAEIVIPQRAVSGRFGNKMAWLRTVSEMLPELIEENNGRTLVLFASYEDLRTVVEQVRGPIEAMSIPLLVQQQGVPTAALCEEFRSIQESVLFGVDTFWHGVDFRGDTLTQVVITRIPFPSPFEALQQTRKRILSEESYWRRYHYDTEIKLRQGIGRLIRGEGDSGRVVVLDRRFPIDRFGTLVKGKTIGSIP